MNRKLILLAILGCFTILGSAQNTDSPYSRYGYGVLQGQAIGASKAMGGISYGLRRGDQANPSNPASYSVVDSLTFIFDIGINYTSGQLNDGTSSFHSSKGGLDYITMLLPLSKRLGLSFGILPYSSVGYKYGTNTYVGGVNYQSLYKGMGGFSQLYVGLGYELFKNFSLGANAGFVFSNYKYMRSAPIINVKNVNIQSEISKLGISDLKIDLGAQYTIELENKNSLTLGATFTPAQKGVGNYTRSTEVRDGNGQIIVGGDTTSTKVDAGLPMSIGAGLTFTHKKILVGADVTYQQWKKVAYPGGPDYMNDGMTDANRFNNTWKVSSGLEYTPDKFSRAYFQRMKYRGGVNYGNSYVNVMNSTNQVGGYKQLGATLGLGFPIYDTYDQRTSYLNIGFEYKNLSPNLPNMVKEQYFEISVSVDLNSLWFYKNKLK